MGILKTVAVFLRAMLIPKALAERHFVAERPVVGLPAGVRSLTERPVLFSSAA